MRRLEHTLRLGDLLEPPEGNAEADPECLLFTVNGKDATASLTRSELRRGAHAVAQRLMQHASPGARALIALPTGPDFFTSFFGCLHAGVVPVPVQTLRNAKGIGHLETIAVESGASLLLISRATAERFQGIDGGFWRRTGLQPLVVDAPESIAGADMSVPQPDPDDLAYLQFTSGSTGRPRGVMVSHANVISNVKVIDAKAGRPRGRAAVSWLPLYHDMGLVSVLYALYAGLKMVLLSPTDFVQHPWRWLKAISHFQAVYSGGPNFAYELCTRSDWPQDEPGLDLSHWQFAFCGAEMVRPATLRRFAERFEPSGFRASALSPAYGLAESTLIVAGVPAGQEAEVRRLDPASLTGGRALPAAAGTTHGSTEVSECGTAGAEHRIRVVEPGSGRAIEDGEVGEIWVSGPSRALGYWQREDESRATFAARLEGDGAAYLRTGDLGFMDSGRLFVTGRIKELVIVRGRNYHPLEIEEAAAGAHPALSPIGAAFGVMGKDSEALVLISELRRGSRRNAQMNEVLLAVQDELVQRLNVKADVIGLVKPGTIPRTTSGKVQRLKCRDIYQAGLLSFLAVWPAPSDGARPAPEVLTTFDGDKRRRLDRATIERWIVGRLSSRMGVAPSEVDPRQPLSAYGLDSLGAVELTREIQEWLQEPLPETLVWSYPTPEDLSQYLEQVLRRSQFAMPAATAPRPGGFRSQVDLALQWVERLSDIEVDHLYRQRIAHQ